MKHKPQAFLLQKRWLDAMSLGHCSTRRHTDVPLSLRAFCMGMAGCAGQLLGEGRPVLNSLNEGFSSLIHE